MRNEALAIQAKACRLPVRRGQRSGEGSGPAGDSLPVAGVVEMEDMRGRERHDPQADDQGADGQNPLAGRTIMGGKPGGFVDTKDLAADADGHQNCAENEREPSHGVPLYPIWSGCGKRELRRPGHQGNTAARQAMARCGKGIQMKAIERGAVLLGLAVLMAGGPAGWSQQAAPAAGPPKAQEAAPEENPNTVKVEPVGHLFSEDESNLKDYWPAVASRTQETWVAVMPAMAKPPRSAGGQVKIEAVLHTDGRVTNLRFEDRSGQGPLDRAAWTAIVRSVPYDAFPSGISADQATVRFTFIYNGGGAANIVPGGHVDTPR